MNYLFYLINEHISNMNYGIKIPGKKFDQQCQKKYPQDTILLSHNHMKIIEQIIFKR